MLKTRRPAYTPPQAEHPMCSSLVATCSRTKWKSISMCLGLAWNTGFAAKYVAPMLSQYKIGVQFILICSSFSRDSIQMISDVAFANDLYSTSILDRATVCWFFSTMILSCFPSILNILRWNADQSWTQPNHNHCRRI